MKLTKANLLKRIERKLVTYKVKWDDVMDDFDMAIEEINTFLSTKYPTITSVLTESSPPEKTYTFRASGVDMNFFPEKYIHSIVIPFVITRILRNEEDFSNVYTESKYEYQDNLFVMARDEIHHIPKIFMSAPKGVYFPKEDETYRQDPEKYFNREIVMDVPKLKVTYDLGNLEIGSRDISVFVSKPLPVDDNNYEIGTKIMPVIMQGANFDTLVVDENSNVLGTFVGWSLEKEGDYREIVRDAITINEDLKLYAVFDFDIIRFKYTGNGGSLSNWKPQYLNKNSVTAEGVTPYGGTAMRRGYNFLGFSPNRIEKSEIEEKFGTSNEYEEYQEEGELEFIAQWKRIFYNLTFIGAKTNVNIGRSKYVHGEEFDLVAPEEDPSSPDEFVGWWDNSLFEGDPISRIFESDFGNKVFYAKYSEESYRVNWYAEDGITLIRSDVLAKNSLVEAPVLSDQENIVDEEGLYWRRNFSGFYDSDGNVPQKVIRNVDYAASYSEKIAVTTNVYINFREVVEGSVVDSSDTFDVQKGSFINKSTLISFLTTERRSYLDNPTEKYISDFSLISIDGTPLSGDEVQINETLSFYAVYSTTVFDITLYKKTDYENGELILDADFSKTITVPYGTTKEYILGIMTESSIGIPSNFEITDEVNNQVTKYFVNDIIEKTSEESLEEPITSNMELVVTYTVTENETYIKKLTIKGFPSHDSFGTRDVILEYAKGTNIDLTTLKNVIEPGKTFLYNDINGYYTSLIDGNYSNPITNIVLNIDRTIYVQTVSLLVSTVFFYIYDFYGNLVPEKIKELYPKDFTEIEVNGVQHYEEEFSNLYSGEPLHPSSNYKRFIGWNLVEADAGNAIVQEKLILDDPSGDVYVYPVYEDLKGFKINLAFKTSDGNDLKTDYAMGQELNVSLEPYEQNKTKIIFQNYEDVLKFINNRDTHARTNQQLGYTVRGYLYNGLLEENTDDIMIDIPPADTEVQELTLTFVLNRDYDYAFFELNPDLYVCYPIQSTDPSKLENNAYAEFENSNDLWRFKWFAPKDLPYKGETQGVDVGWIDYAPKLNYRGSLVGSYFQSQETPHPDGTSTYRFDFSISCIMPYVENRELSNNNEIFLIKTS